MEKIRINEFFMDNAWRWKCGLKEKQEFDRLRPGSVNLEDMIQTEWDDEFEQLMRNRLLMGAMRYGKISESGKPQYDRISSIISRLKKYQDDGNKEHLVDAANICLMEFVECCHPLAHFTAVDDGEHTKEI